MTPNYRGPYAIALVPGPGATMQPFRHNDGAMIVLGTDAEGESAPVLHIPMRLTPKRGEAWRTADPDQEAFARALVALLNSLAVERDVSRETVEHSQGSQS
jgi:hypothetical protein